jgi:chromate transporter
MIVSPPSPTDSGDTAPFPAPTLRDIVAEFGRIGLLSFGGPAGQIALMHRTLVEERRWLSEARFLHALNYCMLLPGPEAQQLATYAGWLVGGTRGGIIAGTLFILPGLAVLLALSFAYVVAQDTHWLGGLFFGLKAAVLALVLEALIRVGRRALTSRAAVVLAVAAFLALFVFAVPFPVVIAAAAAIGLVALPRPPVVADAEEEDGDTGGWRRSARVGLTWAVVWAAPVALAALLLGPASTLVAIGVFFSKMAVVTFGGAYAVLAYVADAAVADLGWLKPGEMVDGLALAETTPGPLILVLTYVGFLAGFRSPDGLPPTAGGFLGALMATWVTFAPSFLWIFLGAPHLERLRRNRAASAALSAVTAAVVGVIANLALWFALHVLFRRVDTVVAGPVRLAVPDPTSLDIAAVALAALAAVALMRLKLGVPATLALVGGLGWTLSLGALHANLQ